MFGFRSRVLEFLDAIEMSVIGTGIKMAKIERKLGIVLSNQEVLDAYAFRIAEQNNQIKAAVAVVISEISKLQKAAEVPLDTTKIDAAIEQLTAAVDEVEAIPAPAVEEAPVEEAPAVPTAPVEEVENETSFDGGTFGQG